jgi:hypothetical protein
MGRFLLRKSKTIFESPIEKQCDYIIHFEYRNDLVSSKAPAINQAMAVTNDASIMKSTLKTIIGLNLSLESTLESVIGTLLNQDLTIDTFRSAYNMILSLNFAPGSTLESIIDVVMNHNLTPSQLPQSSSASEVTRATSSATAKNCKLHKITKKKSTLSFLFENGRTNKYFGQQTELRSTPIRG